MQSCEQNINWHFSVACHSLVEHDTLLLTLCPRDEICGSSNMQIKQFTTPARIFGKKASESERNFMKQWTFKLVILVIK